MTCCSRICVRARDPNEGMPMKSLVYVMAALAVLLTSATIARADAPQLPPLREGLWESHTRQTTKGSNTETVLRLCRTHDYDQTVRSSMNLAGENTRKLNQCTEKVKRRSASSYSSEMHCAKDSSVTKVTMTFQGDTSYHMDMQLKKGGSETVMIIDDRYVGSCPADMKPGDAVTGDGKKMNLASP
jgi:hypothetical protein